jgi:hypothetical protein
MLRRKKTATGSGNGGVRDETPRTGPNMHRQREEFGGINWGAAFFGWLVAMGLRRS